MGKRHKAYWIIALFTLLLLTAISVKKAFSQSTSNSDASIGKRLPKTVAHHFTDFKPSTVVANSKVDNYLQNLHFSGTALIIRKNRIILQKAYGDSNKKAHHLNQTNTTYYIGSAEKALIATAILQLQEKGKLNVNNPVNNYLAAFPNGQRIKISNLLHHTSGLRGHIEEDKEVTAKELVIDIEKKGITKQPGIWHYLDSNYTVLAYLVEKLSGMPLQDYLKRYIIQPAGMQHTGNYQDYSNNSLHSVGYVLHQGKYIQPILPNLSQLFGVGNMYMTVTDMYRFDEALMHDKLISNYSRRQMFKSGSRSGYGMGFYVDPGSYTSHGVLDGWNVSNSFTHTGKTYIILMSNVQNNIPSFGRVTGHIYGLINHLNR